jgi:hypothetical protein
MPFGIVCGHLLYFFPIWNVWTKKNLATLVLKHFSGRPEKTSSGFHVFVAAEKINYSCLRTKKASRPHCEQIQLTAFFAQKSEKKIDET